MSNKFNWDWWGNGQWRNNGSKVFSGAEIWRARECECIMGSQGCVRPIESGGQSLVKVWLRALPPQADDIFSELKWTPEWLRLMWNVTNCNFFVQSYFLGFLPQDPCGGRGTPPPTPILNTAFNDHARGLDLKNQCPNLKQVPFTHLRLAVGLLTVLPCGTPKTPLQNSGWGRIWSNDCWTFKYSKVLVSNESHYVVRCSPV